MLIKRGLNGIDLPYPSEITPLRIFESRRTFIRQMAAGSIAGGMLLETLSREAFAQPSRQMTGKLNPSFVASDNLTPYKVATTYNNYYEFGTDKSEPALNAGTLKTLPWTLSIEGEIKKPVTLDIDTLIKIAPLEERIYRLRCVEGWSMVVPWVGYPLSDLIKKVEPNGNAKYVEFTTLADKQQMPGIASSVLQWPYVEGLRIDEANHPLTLLTMGMYGKVLPNQNGAPVRIMVPWKYGFKSAKSIVKIRFIKEQPKTAWNRAAPSEYGFYSNVNPGLDHPRWSQAHERRIGEDGLFAKKRKTLMFNGYSEVASLYTGMDLKKLF